MTDPFLIIICAILAGLDEEFDDQEKEDKDEYNLEE